jgi:hypothetical protein
VILAKFNLKNMECVLQKKRRGWKLNDTKHNFENVTFF